MGKAREKAEAFQRDFSGNRYMAVRMIIAAVLSLAVIVCAVSVIAAARLTLSRDQLFKVNRTRIGTVLQGLESGGVENGELVDEYDRFYIAKLKNTWYYCDSLLSGSLNGGSVRNAKNAFDDSFIRDAAEYAGVEEAAIIDSEGNTYAAVGCDYDFTRKRFRMLREQLREDGTSEPFSIFYADGTRRFYGIQLRSGYILVFAVNEKDINPPSEMGDRAKP